MNKPKYKKTIAEATKLSTVPVACDRYMLGRAKLMEIAENENAIRRFGRAVRIDVSVLDKAIANY